MYYASNMLTNPVAVQVGSVQTNVKLPDGCVGILFVFKTKKACRAWHGTKCTPIKMEKDEGAA